jgi:CRISPR-associated protein Csb2
MPTLLLRSPGRRYHATPWGHHVNEGQVEWPPSPWRLLRALLSVGYTHLHWPDAGPPPEGRRLIDKLASVLPRYRLPRAAGGHSRHYMPIGELKDGVEKTTLVFDTWAQVADGALAVRWDVELDDDERRLLAGLAANLNYLGRSESWVDAALGREEVEGFDVVPDAGAPHQRGWEQVSLMTPTSEPDFAAWRSDAVQQAREMTGVDLTKKKHTASDKKKLDTAEAPYPSTLIDCLQADSSWLRSHGWNQPPGSRKTFYWRRRDALEVGAPLARSTPREPDSVEMILLSIASASRSRGLLPHANRTLPQGELLHRALVSREPIPVFTGTDEGGSPLREGHRHTHILHLDLDGDQRLDHVLLWAPMGFGGRAQAAVRAVRRTFTKGGAADLHLMLVGMGSATDLARLAAPIGPRLGLLWAPESSTTWKSLTPFVPPRHLKQRGKDTLDAQIQAELSRRGVPPPSRIIVRDPHDDDDARRLRHTVCSRQRGPRPPQECSFAVDLVFEQPVRGPIALGYGSHFGLGLFAATDSRPG